MEIQMKKILAFTILICSVTACNKEPENLKSPCVGKSGSPCSRIPVNQELYDKNPLKV
jgi:hypothetical protein